MRHIATLTLLALLCACGQTGPLYMPGEEPERHRAGSGSEEPDTTTEEN